MQQMMREKYIKCIFDPASSEILQGAAKNVPSRKLQLLEATQNNL